MAKSVSRKLFRPHWGRDASQCATVATRRYRSVVLSRHFANGPWVWNAPEREHEQAQEHGLEHPPSYYAVLMTARGEGIPLRGRDQALPPALFLTPDSTVAIDWAQPTDIATVWVPRDALAEYTDVAPSSWLALADSALMQATRAFVASLVTSGADASSVARYGLERLLVEMVFSAVLEQGVIAVPGQAPASLIDQARALILLHRADAAFTPTRLAGELHVSVRQLQRAFAEAGATPAGVMRRARVDLALELLQHPDYAPLSMEAIAVHAGFGSGLRMRRALASEGVVAPSLVRRDAAAAVSSRRSR